MRRVATGIGLGLTLWASPAWGQAIDRFDCSSFTSQNAAQVVLDADRTDPNRLDADGDGIACEELPQVSTAAVTATTVVIPRAPTGPVEARALPAPPPTGSVARTGPSEAHLGLAGLGLLVTGLTAIAVPQRRSRAGPWDLLPRRHRILR